jgi:hypothetical protein
MKEEETFGSKLFVDEMREYLNAEMTLIYGIIVTNKLKDRSFEIRAMIGSLIGTGNAIMLLSTDNQRLYNECVMLSRGFFERITNICYLLLCDEKTYNECIKDHTLYRQYLRGSNNEKVMKDDEGKTLLKIELKREGIENLKKEKDYKEAIDKFEKSQKTRFPIPKIEKRLGFLAKAGTNLNVSVFLAYQQAYYDDASEALHGSFYGGLFHVINLNSRDQKEMAIETNQNTTLLLWQTGELLNQLIELLNQKNDLQDFHEKSIKNSEVMLAKMKSAMDAIKKPRTPT